MEEGMEVMTYNLTEEGSTSPHLISQKREVSQDIFRKDILHLLDSTLTTDQQSSVIILP